MSAPTTYACNDDATALIPVRSSALLDLVGEYSTIVADPPWDVKFGQDTKRGERDSTGGPKGGWVSEANINYNTMTLDEIKALPVASAAAENAHLYIWTINAYIEQTYALARAWSFRPVALLTWAKTPRGLGFGGAFVQTTEHVLFCRRGLDIAKQRVDSTWWNWTRPEKDTGPKHSRKPEAFQRLVESVSPGPYLEMFARRKRDGWDVWGNEV